MSCGRGRAGALVVLGLCGPLLVSLTADAAARSVPAVSLAKLTEATIRVAGAPDWMVTDGSAVWVKQDSGQVSRIDPATNELTTSIDVTDDLCQGLAFGDAALWTCDGGDLVRIDPATGEIVARIPVDKAKDQGHLPVDAGRVWVITGADAATLAGVSTATNTVDGVVPLGGRCTDTTSGLGSIWIACVSGEVLRVDPASGTVTARIPDLPLATAITTNAQAVFVGYEGGIARIDPETDEVVRRTKVPLDLSVRVAADDDHVWVRADGAPFLRVIDATSMKQVQRVRAKTDSSGDLLLAFGSLWASTYDDAFVYRLEPPPAR